MLSALAGPQPRLLAGVRAAGSLLREATRSAIAVMNRSPPSPARLRHTGNLARVGEVAQADAAQPELAEHGARPSAPATPGVRLHLELGLALLLLDECLFGHSYCPSRRNGNPKAASSPRPSSLVRAVVTIVMSMPRVTSILS